MGKRYTNDWMGLHRGANHSRETKTYCVIPTRTDGLLCEQPREKRIEYNRFGDECQSKPGSDKDHDRDAKASCIGDCSNNPIDVVQLNNPRDNNKQTEKISSTSSGMSAELEIMIANDSPPPSVRSSLKGQSGEITNASRDIDEATSMKLHPFINCYVEIDQVTSKDVLFGRGRHQRNHVGNINMRKLARSHRELYKGCQDRDDKTYITRSIVDSIHAHGGRFLKYHKESQRWVVVSDVEARQKVSHAIRDDPAVLSVQRHQICKPLVTAKMSQHAPLSPTSLNLSNDDAEFLISLFR